ncbi:MAG: ABC transporter permease [Lawsonibacter sp.]|nr:ABC transporter permease [Lawsonibacter sp.]
MIRYLTKRLAYSLIAVLGITLIVFIALNLSRNPVELMLPPSATKEDMEEMREIMGFNDPILVQYGRFLKGAVVGDFGQSYNYDEPALDVVLERLPATLKLSAAALLLAAAIGIPAGVISAVRRGKLSDVLIRITALVGQCMPGFWLGIMMMLLFSVKLGWLPTSAQTAQDGVGAWKVIIMPAIALSVNTAATITRLLRSNMLDVMNKEYIDVARSKGLGAWMVVMKHAFKNAITSIITVLGMQIANMVGGAVIIETVFAWPGVGRLAVMSITNGDFMVVEAIVFILAVAFVLVNFLVDVLYCVINPRVQLQ